MGGRMKTVYALLLVLIAAGMAFGQIYQHPTSNTTTSYIDTLYCADGDTLKYYITTWPNTGTRPKPGNQSYKVRFTAISADGSTYQITMHRYERYHRTLSALDWELDDGWAFVQSISLHNFSKDGDSLAVGEDVMIPADSLIQTSGLYEMLAFTANGDDTLKYIVVFEADKGVRWNE